MCKNSLILSTDVSVTKASLDKNPLIFDSLKQSLAENMYALILQALKNNIADTANITEDEIGIRYQLQVEIKSGLRYEVCDTSRIRENK